MVRTRWPDDQHLSSLRCDHCYGNLWTVDPEGDFVCGLCARIDQRWCRPEHKAFVDSLPLYDPPSLESKLREMQAEAQRLKGLPAEAIIARQSTWIKNIALLLEASRGVEGAHHLQWFLSQIGIEIGIDDLDPGIAP